MHDGGGGTGKPRAADKLIVALDGSVTEAFQVIDQLGGLVSFYKVGIRLQLEGFAAQHLIRRGKRVFLDLKYNDIPKTMETAVRYASEMGVDFLSIFSGFEGMCAAYRGRGNSKLKLLAVTLLTSDLGRQTVYNRADLAGEAGMDGVICSGLDAWVVRHAYGSKFLIVSPGIRPEGFEQQDQARACTPAQAIKHGADYLVVGRPITTAENPRQVAEQIIKEIDGAMVQWKHI